MPSETLLSIRDLCVAYRHRGREVHAVRGVSLEIRSEEFLGLVGESGCGKTTVPLALMGLLPSSARILGGSAVFDGKNLLALDESEMRAIRGRRMAMIFQDPMTSLNPYQRVGLQIAEPARLHLRLDAAAARKRAISLLESVGIGDAEMKAESHPHELSGGMRQRVMIAMALSCGPGLVLADEPTTALDVSVQAQILRLMAGLRREMRLSMLLISHDLSVVAELCDRIAVMYAGMIVEEGPAAEVLKNPSHPYTCGLLASRPSLEGRRGRLRSIPGQPPELIETPEECAFAPRCPYAEDSCRRAVPKLADIGNARRLRCILGPAPEGTKR